MSQVNRLNRKSYIVSYLVVYAVVFLAYIIDVILYAVTGTDFESNKFGMPFLLISVIVGTVYGVKISNRRLHDIDMSGWWQLVLLVPLVSLFVTLTMLFKKGNEEKNEYGKPVEGLHIYWKD